MRIKFFLFLSFGLCFLGSNLPLLSSINLEKEKTYNSITSDYLKQLPANDYIVGPGDTLNILISREYTDLNSIVQVDGEGTIYLPRLKRVFVKDLTLTELNQIVNNAYKKFLKNPSVEITIKSYRPIRVFVEGEVVNPGVQSLKGSYSLEEFSDKDISSQFQNNAKSYFFPTVFDAIRSAGGITAFSDLSNVQVIRQNNLSDGGGKIVANLNFDKVIIEGDNSQNIRIYNSDIIKVSKDKSKNSELVRKAILSNLSPKFVNIFVAGRVNNPGSTKIPTSSTLHDAIDMAGGTKILKGPITFLRFRNDGTIDKRVFNLRKSHKRGTFKNPELKDGDFIVVGNSLISNINEVTKEITSPFVGVFSTYGLINALTD
ncbi:polysaccharide biosynthesis/export family protein [Prochlorococcus marinus]|uniref:polysaccharide biosynthesis/export family protein n=1 Tax=Prochlorococcus marinus TaxID=1219 RepID=UPI001AD977F6|nr:polysaccharide biosynthesis/export family protein [Prochlorococcus marinus]MBO8219583.1 hypothetical protein [Prochlorococcus marinus CUG1416]MBW3051956.1 hypothetical protein [Prochlorococcus marinus str. MU1416]